MFQIDLSKESSTNHRRSSIETSMFRGLPEQKKFHQKSVHRNHQGLINVYSKNHQKWLINPAAMKHQNLKISTLKTLMINNVCIQRFVFSSRVLQRVINESSTKKQWNIGDSEVDTTKTKKIKKVSIETTNVSIMSLQSVINLSSTKQQWNINVSEIRSIKTFMIINVWMKSSL